MVERIRKLCRQNGTSITKLESQLGFGNGAIGKWKKTKPPYERLQKVAAALGVTVGELTGEEEKPAAAEQGELTEMQTKAVEMIKNMTDAQLKAFIAAAEAFLR